MANGYWIGAYRSVSDPDKLAADAKIAGPAVEELGGRFLSRAGAIEVREAGITQRAVLVEFDSFEAAVGAYDSDAYQAALAVLDGGAERDMRIVEGV